MKNLLRRSVLGVSGALLLLAAPLPASAQDVLSACAPAIKAHCSDVTPGHGRMYSCLYSYEDKLSEACNAASADVLDSLDAFFGMITYVKQQCIADIATHCESVAKGNGRVLACLQDKQSELSESCAPVVARLTDIQKEETEE